MFPVPYPNGAVKPACCDEISFLQICERSHPYMRSLQIE